MKKKFNVKMLAAVLSLVFLSTSAFANGDGDNQRDDNDHHQIENDCKTDNDHKGDIDHKSDDDDRRRSAPFDGGVSLLVAAGVGYASKKAVDKRKKQEEAKNL